MYKRQPIYFEAIYENSLRISRDQFVAKTAAHFPVEAMDEALDRICIGKYIPLPEATNFGAFPYVGFPWNIFLLEHYVASYSQKYMLLHKMCIRDRGMFGHLTVRPAVNAPFVPLIGEVDPAQPVGCNAAMVFAAPSIFWQSPIFYILTGTPVGQFNPCGVGGITHPERMASPAEGPGRSVIPNGGGLKKV